MLNFVRSVCAVAFVSTGLLAHDAVAQAEFDTAPVVYETLSVLPGINLNGDNYQIAPTVRNDGAINHYTLSVKGVSYEIQSTDLLLSRLREAAALGIMDKRSNSGAFGDAVGQAVKAPFRGAKGLVTSPVETVTGFVSGVGSFFESLGHAAVGSSSDQEAGIFKTAIGYGAGRRGLAAKFRIDPYTNFPPVKDKLSSLSWASAGGGFAVSGGLSTAGGPGQLVSGIGSTYSFGQLIYDTSPADLKDRNEERLKVMGVSSHLVRTFLNHPQFTPTHTTEIVDALASVSAYGRDAVVARSVLADNENAAFFMMRWAQMYAAYHRKIKPIERFVPLGALPVAQRSDGVLVIALPIDHLLWTRATANTHLENMRRLRQIEGVTGGEVWFAGTISPLAQRTLEGQNWVVMADQGKALGIR